MASLEHQEAGGIDPDVVDELIKRNEFAASLRHLCLLATLNEMDELQEHRLEAVLGKTERDQRRAHPRHVAVMIRAEHVDQMLSSALKLVAVVRDVRHEVRLLAVGAD